MAKRYLLQGVDGETKEHLGNTLTVYDKFAILHQDTDVSVPKLSALSQTLGMDVVLVPKGALLEIVQVIEHEEAIEDAGQDVHDTEGPGYQSQPQDEEDLRS